MVTTVFPQHHLMMRTLHLSFALLIASTILAQDPDDDLGFGGLLPTRRSLAQIPFEENFQLPAGYTLPMAVDLSAYFPPAGNQRRQYSCTAWATAYGLKTFQENFKSHRMNAASAAMDANVAFSPAFVYDNSRDPQDVNPCKAGAYMSNVLLFIANNGVCKWSVFPYDTSYTSCTVQVPRSAFDAATAHKFINPLQLSSTNIDQVKYHLAQNEPVVLMACLDSTFKKGGRKAGGLTTFSWNPVPGNTQCGYHAMICVGYDDDSGGFLVLNSWGTNWGKRGYCWIPYAVWAERVKEAYVAGDASLAPPNAALSKLAGTAPPAATEFSGSLALGQYQVFNNIRFGLTRMNADHANIQMEFRDNNANTLINSMAFNAKQPRTLFYNNQRITFSFEPASATQRNAPSNSISFTISIESLDTDPAFNAVLKNMVKYRKPTATLSMPGH